MSAESRLLAMETELSRHRKLINYLLTNKSSATLKSGYMFGAAATRSLKDGRTLVVGLCLTVDDIGIDKDTNGEGEITDFEFTLVDILNQGIEKSELPKNENGEVDILQFIQVFIGRISYPTPFIFVNLMQTSTKYLRFISEVFYTYNSIDIDNVNSYFFSTATAVGGANTDSNSQSIQKWFYENAEITEIASAALTSGAPGGDIFFTKVFDYSITYKNKKVTISKHYAQIEEDWVPEFEFSSIVGGDTFYFRDEIFSSLKVKY